MSEGEPRIVRIVEDRWSNIRHIVEAVAIVAAGFWAFYTFVYQERIKPANEPAALDPHVDVRRLGRDARNDIITVDIVLHNTGKTELDIAADAFNVWGERYGSRPKTSLREGGGKYLYSAGVPVVSAKVILAFAELRDASIGGIPGTHIVIEPDASVTLPEVVVVRRGDYDLIRAQVIAVPVKTSDQRKVHVDVVHARDHSYELDSPDGFEDDNDTHFALVP